LSSKPGSQAGFEQDDAAPRKLRPRRGALSRAQVRRHQRARLRSAIVARTLAEGYGAITARSLCARAGVSTRTLYEIYPDGKEGCLRDAYEAILARLLSRAQPAGASRVGWRMRVERALGALLTGLAEEPQEGRFALFAPVVAGPAGAATVARAGARAERVVASAFAQAPARLRPPPLHAKLVIGGIARVAAARLLSGRAAELPNLAGELVEWSLRYCSPALAQLPQRAAGAAEDFQPSWPGPLDERTALLEAAARMVARTGYERLSAAAVARESGLSADAFYRHFADCEECFRSALRLIAARSLALAAGAAQEGGCWQGGIHRAVLALARYLASDPAVGRCVFIEVSALGEAGLLEKEALLEPLIALHRELTSPVQAGSLLQSEATVGGAWQIVRHYVLAGRLRTAAERAPYLSYLALVPAVGARAAVRAICAEEGRLARERRRALRSSSSRR